MARHYTQITDEKRAHLVRLIHSNGYSIAKAAKEVNIPYDNAKAINRTFNKEERVKKISYKQRYHRNRRALSEK